jgi:hypothetical protein
MRAKVIMKVADTNRSAENFLRAEYLSIGYKASFKFALMVAQNQQSIKHLREMPAVDIQQAFYLRH